MSFFSDFLSYLSGPSVNVDGTPMISSTSDVKGNPFGVTDTHDSFISMNMFDSSNMFSTDSLSSFDSSNDFTSFNSFD